MVPFLAKDKATDKAVGILYRWELREGKCPNCKQSKHKEGCRVAALLNRIDRRRPYVRGQSEGKGVDVGGGQAGSGRGERPGGS